MNTPLRAAMVARAPTEMLSAMATAPPRTAPSPMETLPPMAQQPQMTTERPMRQLWAIWTRLSILVPSPTRVTPNLARSTQEFAPISTSAPISTMPTWGILRRAPVLGLGR